MKIAVELEFFGEKITKVVDYPGAPRTHTEVIQWLMNQTDYKWADYENAPEGERLLFDLGMSVPQ